MAPAASVGPSVPSVPQQSTAIPPSPSISSAADMANSWLRPPLPSAPSFMVTVVSPPEIRQAGAARGSPVARISRPMALCMRAISRVSPSMVEESTRGE